jgi:signal transduction histidine kinase
MRYICVPAKGSVEMSDDAAPERLARRLSTLAAMSRPVQHELNNLLTVIYANVELLKRSAAEGAPQRQLDRIQQATKRLDDATRSILTLNRRPVPEAAVAAPLDCLRLLAPLLKLLLAAPGALALDLPEGEAWKVQLDRAALEQALMDLAQDAAVLLPRGAALGLAVVQMEAEVRLAVAWPEGVAGPGAPVLAGFVALGAEQPAAGHLLLRWPRVLA